MSRKRLQAVMLEMYRVFDAEFSEMKDGVYDEYDGDIGLLQDQIVELKEEVEKLQDEIDRHNQQDTP